MGSPVKPAVEKSLAISGKLCYNNTAFTSKGGMNMESMALTPMAQGLTDAFYSMDYAILEFYHNLAQSAAGKILAPILNVITLTGWKGALLILLSIVMICFPKTRRTGICALLAMAIGALFTNIVIKNAVARPRPYDFDETLRMWWIYAGSHMETGFSFPSGHMTAACAFSTGFALTRGWKRWLPVGLVYVILMGASRNFLVVHYPSDVLGGFVFGVCAGIISFCLVRAIYRKWGQTRFLKDT